MANSNNSNTYIQGAIKPASDCLDVVVYNRFDFEDLEKISLYNINTLYPKILSGKYLRIHRDSSSNSFFYSHENDKISGFNTIIYLNNSSKSPIGYTEFLNTQGSGRDVEISLDFSVSIGDEDGKIKLVNSLVQLKNSTTSLEKFISDELCDFTSSEKLLKEKEDFKHNFRYTNSIERISKETKSCILNNNLNLFKDNSSRLNIFDDTLIDPFELGFTNHQVGFYQGDLVLYSWYFDKSNKRWNYYIRSLIKTNNFGVPQVYTKSPTGYYSLKTDKNVDSILYFSGRYVVCNVIDDDINSIEVFDTEIKDWYVKKNHSIIIDQFSINNKIYELPKTLTLQTVQEYVPEIKNTFLDLKKYSEQYSFNIERKIGEWIVLRQKVNFKNIYLFVNMTSKVYVTDLNAVKVINNQLLLVDEDNTYGVYGKEFTESYSKSAAKLLGIEETNVINSFKKTDNICDTYLELLRRGSYPQDISGIPEIISTFGGLIFYKKNNILKFL